MAMLGGYAMHGLAMQALRHFKQICDEDVEINNATFVSLLSACSHASLVDGGLCYFESMMNSVGSHGSSSLLFVMKVMVCHFVSDSHEVMTALIVMLPLIVVVEISLQLHQSILNQ
jgi:pentatricopeptide repeat protein